MSPPSEDLLVELRPAAFAIAYRMLGSVAEAEDIVQEALLRVHRALQDGEPIQSPRAYVATVATRLAVDQLRSARARRERYVGEWLPEPLVTDAGDDPARQAKLADSLSLAFLVLLESLSPEQRAVLLLRDVFDYGYGEIARILGISEDNARQLAARARRSVEERRPRFEPSRQQREELARRFFAAAEEGDLGGLEALLAHDVALHGDGGGKVPALARAVHGRSRVARTLIAWARLRREAQSTSALMGSYAPFVEVLAAERDHPEHMSAEVREVSTSRPWRSWGSADLVGRPLVDGPSVADRSGLSGQGATNAIRTLVELGLLEPAPTLRTARPVLRAPRVLSILAARSRSPALAATRSTAGRRRSARTGTRRPGVGQLHGPASVRPRRRTASVRAHPRRMMSDHPRAMYGPAVTVAASDSRRSPLAGMTWVPGGTFAMGSEDFYPEERPVHRVSVDGFWMDTHPVTVAEFRRFVTETDDVTVAERPLDPGAYRGVDPELLVPGSLVFRKARGPVDLRDVRNWWVYAPGASWRAPAGPGSSIAGRHRHPVTHVAYEDAAAYAAWAGKELPTEAEWERAARGGLDGATFAWGDDFAPNGRMMANTWQGEFPWQNLCADGYEGTSPVGTFTPTGFGLFDMTGNVWEWTADVFTPGHPGDAARACCAPQNPRVASPQGDEPIPRRVIKGGSHLCAPNYCLRYRPAARQGEAVDTSTSHIGFRCIVRSP